MAARQSGAARREGTGLPRVVWVLAGGSFVNNFGGFVVPFPLLYLVHRGYGVRLAAWAVSAYAAGKMAAGLPVSGPHRRSPSSIAKRHPKQRPRQTLEVPRWAR